MTAELPRTGVRAVERALDLLLAFSDEHPHLYLNELAEATALPKASVHRLAASLIRLDFLRQDDEGRYQLGDQLIMLGELSAASSPTLRVVEPILDELAERCRETLLVTDLDWVRRSFVVSYRRDGIHRIRAASPRGRRTRLSTGALGKAALATVPDGELAALLADVGLVRRTPRSICDPAVLRRHLAAAREFGWATDVGEYIDGVTSVARAIRAGPRIVGVLGIVAPSQYVSERRISELGRMLVDLTEAHAPESVPEVLSVVSCRRSR